MVSEACAFETDRLLIDEWRAAALIGRREQVLADVVASLMTPSATRALPAAWQGDFTPRRAEMWIAERDSEGPTLLASDRFDSEAVGLVILFESAAAGGSGVDVRLGYVLAESGLGTRTR